VYLPDLDEQPNKHTDLDNCVGFVVQDVQKDNDGLEHVEEHRPHRQTLQWLPTLPKLDICRRLWQKYVYVNIINMIDILFIHVLVNYLHIQLLYLYNYSIQERIKLPNIQFCIKNHVFFADIVLNELVSTAVSMSLTLRYIIHTIFECEELEDTVDDGDYDGQAQQVGIRLQKRCLWTHTYILVYDAA